MDRAKRTINIVGSGPNGLTAAVYLARAGLPVRVLEGSQTPGGGCRSEELTLPGFTHDVCSTVHPMGLSSPAFKSLDLSTAGLHWAHAPIALAHPLDDGDCAFLPVSMNEAVLALGKDGEAYRKLFKPLANRWDELLEDLLVPPHFPKHPLLFGGFGMQALKSAEGLARSHFSCESTRALFAGMAAHAMLPLSTKGSAAFGLVLGASLHAVGWPLAISGSSSIVTALLGKVEELGGVIETGMPILSPSDLPDDGPTLLTMNPRQLISFGGERLPASYLQGLKRFRYGPGVCKVDWALSEPIPWIAEPCRQALTVHVGGTLEEINESEAEVNRGIHPERPYTIVVQPTLVDKSRAPEGKHVGWAYCHVPNGSPKEMTEQIEAQVERLAPGFRDCIMARHVRSAAAMEMYNPSYVGGDIGGGAQSLRQTLMRPVPTLNPHRIPQKDWYLCSASTPPGGGVHGMCGLNAARLLMKDLGISWSETDG